MNKDNHVRKLVLSTAQFKKMSKSDVVRQSGYANLNKGLRRLESLLHGGLIDQNFIKKICEVLEISRVEMDDAIEKDVLSKNLRQEIAERESFKPYIYLCTKATRPSQITMFALTGGTRIHKMFFVPEDLPEKPWEQQVTIVKSLARSHYNLLEGVAPFFGAITGYLYCPTYDSSYEFTLGGDTDAVDRGHFKFSEASIRVK